MLSRLLAWFGRIRMRLLLVNLVVLLVPIAGIEAARVYEHQLLGSLERDMRNQAVLVRALVEHGWGRGDRLAEYEPVLEQAARRSRTRVRLIDEAGEVMADSHRNGPPEGPEPPPPEIIPGVRELRSDIEQRGQSGRGWLRREPDERWPLPGKRNEVTKALSGTPASYTRVRAREPSVILFIAEPVRYEGDVVAAVYVTRSTRPVMAELYRIRSRLFQLLGVSLAFTVTITLVLAWSISRPLGKLARAARRIAGGEPDVRVPVEGGGEVRELGEAFATMTQRLDQRMRYIADFTADVAHELKSPLTSIRGAAELLGEGAADDPEARERFLRNIQVDADRLDRLVSRLLELSRLEASREPMQPLDVRALVDRVVARTHTDEQPVLVSWQAERDPARATSTSPGGGATLVLHGREADLERALLNLVENALRFSPEGKPVRIEVSGGPRRGTLLVAVSDEGPGIAPEHLPRIFDRFFTTDEERNGTGLGLAIVRTVVEAHGGRVDVDTAPERGCRVTLALPLSPSAR